MTQTEKRTMPEGDKAPMDNDIEIYTEKVNLWYGKTHSLLDIDIAIKKHKVTALIGPSGCGKSTLLRCFNRMNDIILGCRVEGKIFFQKKNILSKNCDVVMLRKEIGMVFQKPNPFPKSVYENVAYGPRVHGITDKCRLDAIVEKSIKGAALWEEVHDRQ
jgi:phosphate transport system ATP-binding protein